MRVGERLGEDQPAKLSGWSTLSPGIQKVVLWLHVFWIIFLMWEIKKGIYFWWRSTLFPLWGFSSSLEECFPLWRLPEKQWRLEESRSSVITWPGIPVWQMDGWTRLTSTEHSPCSVYICVCVCVYIYIQYYIYRFVLTWGRARRRERGFRERTREEKWEQNIDVGEKHRLVAFCTRPDQGLNLQPRHVLGPGIKPVTLLFVGWWQPTEPHWLGQEW